jgi:hypothetical protein
MQTLADFVRQSQGLFEHHVSHFVVRRLVLLAGSIASLLATVGPGSFLLPAASASRIVKGCTIVAHPTLQHHTSCAGAGLSRANLSRTNLSHTNLSRANVSNADLRDADLTDANLSKAKFCHTTMPNAHVNNSGC